MRASVVGPPAHARRCTLAPIWDLLPQLQTLHDWLSIYSVSLSNVVRPSLAPRLSALTLPSGCPQATGPPARHACTRAQDLWFATGVRSLAVLAMASLAPTRRTSRYSATEGKVHPKVRAHSHHPPWPT